MIMASANAYAFIASVVVFTFITHVAKVSSQAVRFSGCDSLQENIKVPVTVEMDGPSAGACSVQPLTQAQFKLTRNGQADVICTQNLASGCDTTPTPEGCVCKSFVNDVYTFELDFTFNTSVHAGGTLDLEPNCFPPGVYTSRSSCDNLKPVDPCENVECKHGGKCEVVNGVAQCNCSGTYHGGDMCEVDLCENKPSCSVTAYPHRTYLIEAVVTFFYCTITLGVILAVLIIANGGGVAHSIRTSLKVKVRLLAKSESQRGTLTSHETEQRIQDFIKKNFICCCCHGIHVEVGATSTGDNLVSITLTHRVIWVFHLLDIHDKVDQFIKTEILKEVGPVNVYSNEPAADYPPGPPMSQPKYTGKGNGQPKKSKSDKEIPLSSVGRSSPPSEASGDEKTHMILPTKGRALPEPTSTGIGKSASPRLDPLTQDHSNMTSVERNSGAFPRKLPSPGQPPLEPIPTGKKS